MNRPGIFTPRLELRLGDAATYSIPPHDGAALASWLDVTLPSIWPVEHYDDDTLKSCLEGKSQLRYVILRESNLLIGIIGSNAMNADSVYIGYSIAPEHQRQGYASEALRGLIEVIFSNSTIAQIVGETYPELIASIRVLEKNGFEFAGDGSGERIIRYVRKR